MTATPLLCVAAALAMASARTSFADSADVDMKLAMEHVAQGEHMISRAHAYTGRAARLAALDRAVELLFVAWSDAAKDRGAAFDDLRKQIDADLVVLGHLNPRPLRPF